MYTGFSIQHIAAVIVPLRPGIRSLSHQSHSSFNDQISAAVRKQQFIKLQFCHLIAAAGVARLAACLGKLDVFGDKAVSVSSGSPMSVATNS
jgi:hypothetical protein